MRNNIIAVTIACFCWINSKSQGNNYGLLTTVFKGQKQYITNSIQQREQSKYLSLLHFANVIHPKVIGEIQKLNASFPATSQTINILEGFTTYSNVNGVIWQDSLYYTYNYGADKKLTVLQRLFSQLNDTAKAIIQGFNNWNASTFSVNGQALGAPTDHPFFLASKVFYSSEPTTQAIGFYYQ